MKLYQIVGSVLEVDPSELSEESNAQNTARWDSLRHIEVILAVESAFHVRFTMPEIAGLSRLGDIRRVLMSKNIKFDVIEAEPQLQVA